MRQFFVLTALATSLLAGQAFAQGIPGAADTSLIPAPQRAPVAAVATQASASSTVGVVTSGQVLPEPASMALLGLGVVALGIVRRRTRG